MAFSDAAFNTSVKSYPSCNAFLPISLYARAKGRRGWRSSLQKHTILGFKFNKPDNVVEILAADPSAHLYHNAKICSFFGFTNDMHSWSVVMPAPKYFSASAPDNPGAWPSDILLYFFASSIFLLFHRDC